MKRAAAAAVILLAASIAAWQGVGALQNSDPEKPALPLGNGSDAAGEEDQPDNPPAPAAKSAPPGETLSRDETPMADRVAVLGLLNKRNGISRDITMKPGQAVRVGDVVIRLRACEQTAPWEAEPLTGAFVQLDVQSRDARWLRVFSGWLYKESPSLNVVEHPIYDVWPKSCAMKHPDIGPDTLTVGQVSSGGVARSSAKKSPDADAGAAAPAAAATPAPSASSNSTL